MSNNENTSTLNVYDEAAIKERWLKPVNRTGTITVLLCIFATFLPAIYLNVTYDAFIGWGAVGQAFLLILAVFGVNWFLEPISYYPVLGNAGSYMSWLAGSVAQQRVPAAVVAKNAMEVEDNTQEAEVVAVVAIAGSVVCNIAVLTLTCFVGTAIIALLPQVILTGIASYVLPAMFGAMLAMFGSQEPLLTIPAFVLMIVLNFLFKKFVTGTLSMALSPVLVLFAIVVTVLYARLLYKKKLLRSQKKKAS